MSHHCHATGCETNVPPALFMCRKHWYMLPKAMRNAIWATYRPGQCDDWNITHEYAEAARDAVRFIASREANTRVYDMLDPVRRDAASVS